LIRGTDHACIYSYAESAQRPGVYIITALELRKKYRQETQWPLILEAIVPSNFFISLSFQGPISRIAWISLDNFRFFRDNLFLHQRVSLPHLNPISRINLFGRWTNNEMWPELKRVSFGRHCIHYAEPITLTFRRRCIAICFDCTVANGYRSDGIFV